MRQATERIFGSRIRGESITVIKTRKDKNRIPEAVFRKYNVKLHRNYSFDREAIHAG